MKYLSFTVLILCLAQVTFASGALAESLTTSAEGSERDALLALLNEQTAIATKTKLNADYVPGIVSVLRGYELEARGYRTVWEALALVPGIDTFLDAAGSRRLAIRGISDTRFSGDVKIMLNDVAVNLSKDSGADAVLSLPIEQIERVEVIRGPGSAVHGEYAYSGVVNVVTRKDGTQVYATTDSNGQIGGGLLLSSDLNDSWHWGLNLAARRSDGGQEETGTDALHNTTPSLAAYSNAPGPANTAHENGSAVFDLAHEGFSLLAQWSTNGDGDHYGINYILPPPDSQVVTRKTYSALVVGQTLEPAAGWRVNLKLGWHQTEQKHDNLYVGPAEAFGGATGPAIVLDSDYRESRVDGGVEILWSGLGRHRVLLGLNHSEVRVDESREWINLDPSTGAPTSTMNDWPTRISPGIQRRIDALMLQDEIRYSDRFTLTVGLRYDQYSDVENHLTPRIAGVWRLDEQHIVKAQYAQAFRPPSFVESKVNGGNILPAIIDTYEIGYICKDQGATTRFNVFYSELSDLIIFDGSMSRYINADRALTQGVEIEHSRILTPALSLDGNIAYAETDESRTGEAIPGATNWLGNLGVTSQFSRDGTLQFQYRYVGERQREPSDPRDASPSYQILDTVITIDNLGYRGMTLRGGVKNLLDATVRYPAQMTSDGIGNPIISYAGDLPGPARTWWLQLAYRY